MTERSATLPSNDGPSHASVFIWLFAVSSIWHYTSAYDDLAAFWLQFDPVVTPMIFLSIATAFMAACAPQKTWTLLVMAAGQLVAICARFPFVADHLVMELFLNVSVLLSFAYLAYKRNTLAISTDDMFALFSPIGRWLLIVMYFYGTFHKINPGFLTPYSSCAIPFINGFPLPAGLLAQPWVQYTAIYGTLIAEFTAMLLLLCARTKYYGMLLGMPFHFLIGISGYGALAHFSAFALSLHTLFVPSTFGKRIFADPLVPAWIKQQHNFRAFTIVFVILQVLLGLHLGFTRHVYLVNALFCLFGVALLYMVFKHGQIRAQDAPYRLRSSFALVNLIPVWFFLHCLSPYIGLGTGGTVAMFSGLRTEGGVSNHYIVQKPIGLFHYQDKVIYIEAASNPSLQRAADDKQGVVMFDFQRHFTTREPIMLPMRLRVGEVVYDIKDQDSLIKFAQENFTEQSWFAQHYMSFRLVDAEHPLHCRH